MLKTSNQIFVNPNQDPEALATLGYLSISQRVLSGYSVLWWSMSTTVATQPPWPPITLPPAWLLETHGPSPSVHLVP